LRLHAGAEDDGRCRHFWKRRWSWTKRGVNMDGLTPTR
jgi:hypothetical protein